MHPAVGSFRVSALRAARGERSKPSIAPLNPFAAEKAPRTPVGERLRDGVIVERINASMGAAGQRVNRNRNRPRVIATRRGAPNRWASDPGGVARR
jgi:hypothetical protein